MCENVPQTAAAVLRTRDLIEVLGRTASHRCLVVRDLVEETLERTRRPADRHERADAPAPQRHRTRRGVRPLPVLITGETGVGKELAVRQLHTLSPRAAEPLVYLNCAALPESVVESELFGHVQGAFTGAQTARPGKFRVAHGSTLFLDEIGELPLSAQPKLLRALQEGEVQPVGADRTEQVDVRILAATNRDLAAEVAAGRFRADLLHRLDVCRIQVPPLREHAEDIPLLTGHFADAARRRLGTGPVRFEARAQAALAAGLWPGNVRELENVIARAVLRASGRVARGEPVIVTATDLGADVHNGAVEGSPANSSPASNATTGTAAGAAVGAHAGGLSLSEAVREFQRDAVSDALRANDGNIAAAARALGMHRSNLHHLIRRLGLR